MPADDFLASFCALKRLPRAQDTPVNNVKNWLNTHKNAIEKDESAWILEEKHTDIIAPTEKPKSDLFRWLEQRTLIKALFRKRPRADQHQTSSTSYHKSTGLERFMRAVVILLGLGMLFGPMWWLNAVHNQSKSLGIITGFVVLFTFILWSVSVAREFEVLAGSAA